MGAPPVFEPLQSREIDDEHHEEEESDIVSVGIVPEGEDALVDHHPLHHHRRDLRHSRRPHLMRTVRFRQHEPHKGEEEGHDGADDPGLGDGELAGRIVEVEPAEGDAAAEEGQIVEIVVLVEAVGVVDELGVVVLPLDHLVDEVEGRHARQDEQDREGSGGRLGQRLLHRCDLLVHHQRHLLRLLLVRAETASQPPQGRPQSTAPQPVVHLIQLSPELNITHLRSNPIIQSIALLQL